MVSGNGNCWTLGPYHFLNASVGGLAIYREADVNLIMTKSLEHFVHRHLVDPDLGTRLFLTATGEQSCKPRLGQAIGQAYSQPAAVAL